MLFKNLIQAAIVFAFSAPSVYAAEISLLNVSYDPTRELYQDANLAFAKQWKAKPATM